LTDLLTSLGPQSLKSIKIEGYFTGNQKADPKVGIPSLLAEIESGQWVIPLFGEHDDACSCSFCTWINEIKMYPLGKTDTVVGSWLAVNALKKTFEMANAGGNFSIWSF